MIDVVVDGYGRKLVIPEHLLPSTLLRRMRFNKP